MAECIDRQKAIEQIKAELAKLPLTETTGFGILMRVLNSIPAADVVSRGAYDQTDWERCVALTQLKEIGKSLGERMDDVRPVVLCRDCRHRDPEDHKCDCGQPERQGCMFPVRDKYWCACGEKREE